MSATTWPFREIWCVDFEFQARDGDKPVPICMVARELRSRRELRVWADELQAMSGPPYGVGSDTLMVAFYASAEVGCHLALGWQTPTNVLDLYAEFRNHTNGLELPAGRGLLGALAYFGCDAISAAEKDAMRDLAIRGGPWTESERRALLEYCAADVNSLEQLLQVLPLPPDPDYALLRGRFMRAAASIERQGIPIDVAWHRRLLQNWDRIRSDLIARLDADFGVYENGSFSSKRFAAFLERRQIPWLLTENRQLALDDDTFRQMSKAFPAVSPLRELRHALSELRLNSLHVGADSRNRFLLSAFGGRTGRNQPSNTKSIFGPSVWLRSLIKPEPGRALAYIDWSQQEFAIAAALSGDGAMSHAYVSGDPYLSFAKQAKAVPPDATKQTHSSVRDQFKACALAVLYGMGAIGLAQRIGQSVSKAEQLLELHRRTFPDYWKWSQAAVDYAMLRGELHTVFDWRIRVVEKANPRSLRNFPMQANGAEMLRLASCFAIERGVAICAPVHDAILIEAPTEEIDDAIRRAKRAMEEASEIVLDGFRLRSDVKIVRSPERYVDDRGRAMWEVVTSIINQTDALNAA